MRVPSVRGARAHAPGRVRSKRIIWCVHGFFARVRQEKTHTHPRAPYRKSQDPDHFTGKIHTHRNGRAGIRLSSVSMLWHALVLLLSLPAFSEPSCEAHCSVVCSELNGDVANECGACSSEWRCNAESTDFPARHVRVSVGEDATQRPMLQVKQPEVEEVERPDGHDDGDLRSFATQGLFATHISTARVEDAEWLSELVARAEEQERRARKWQQIISSTEVLDNDLLFEFQNRREGRDEHPAVDRLRQFAKQACTKHLLETVAARAGLTAADGALEQLTGELFTWAMDMHMHIHMRMNMHMHRQPHKCNNPILRQRARALRSSTLQCVRTAHAHATTVFAHAHATTFFRVQAGGNL